MSCSSVCLSTSTCPPRVRLSSPASSRHTPGQCGTHLKIYESCPEICVHCLDNVKVKCFRFHTCVGGVEQREIFIFQLKTNPAAQGGIEPGTSRPLSLRHVTGLPFPHIDVFEYFRLSVSKTKLSNLRFQDTIVESVGICVCVISAVRKLTISFKFFFLQKDL